jgi:hypothetical protein
VRGPSCPSPLPPQSPSRPDRTFPRRFHDLPHSLILHDGLHPDAPACVVGRCELWVLDLPAAASATTPTSAGTLITHRFGSQDLLACDDGFDTKCWNQRSQSMLEPRITITHKIHTVASLRTQNAQEQMNANQQLLDGSAVFH